MHGAVGRAGASGDGGAAGRGGHRRPHHHDHAGGDDGSAEQGGVRAAPRRVFTIAELLQHLQDPDVLRRPEIRRPLTGLDDTLREARELVLACQDKSAVYRLCTGWRWPGGRLKSSGMFRAGSTPTSCSSP
ncbi:Os11g0664133 [Oryza sativa Japonica Group]|uniref:Os11g0664133 protein n=1 Tax=Oryza sativa subsp. japonica TaxID=39947 RepID=C7J874_ORYSJ|nr:Os11g0664133 [Oryza sativa Japonica Group]|eukprot:NP_001176699.1 Os11g0664133 [Oryza sativa Japonica Group]